MPKTKIGAFFSELSDFKHRRRFYSFIPPPLHLPPSLVTIADVRFITVGHTLTPETLDAQKPATQSPKDT
jgi:hypothetical protein